jgi:hypothetical protein
MDRYGHLFDQSYADASDSIEAALFGPVRSLSEAVQLVTLQAVWKHWASGPMPDGSASLHAERPIAACEARFRGTRRHALTSQDVLPS